MQTFFLFVYQIHVKVKKMRSMQLHSQLQLQLQLPNSQQFAGHLETEKKNKWNTVKTVNWTVELDC